MHAFGVMDQGNYSSHQQIFDVIEIALFCVFWDCRWSWFVCIEENYDIGVIETFDYMDILQIPLKGHPKNQG